MNIIEKLHSLLSNYEIESICIGSASDKDTWKFDDSELAEEEIDEVNSIIENFNIEEWEEAQEKEALIAEIDQATSEAIYSGVEYQGVRFYLTAENQRNFSELDRLRDELTYPYDVWSGDDTIQIQDATQMHEFYLLGLAYIQTTLRAGKAQKDALSITNEVNND